jgi:N-acetylneuraminic acid mutarotase
MQVARGGLGIAAVNGKIYAIGGSTLEGSYPWTGGIVDTNEEYDPASNTWVFKKPMPTPRTDFGIAVYNNKIYCIGGEEIYKDIDRAPLTNVNEVYDPGTDTWETKEPMPTPRSGLRANIVNGKIYLIGGNDPNVHFEPGASTHNEVYDPATDSWSTKTAIPCATYNYASAVVDSKVYVMGGYIGGPGESLRFNLNQIYDAENDSWSYGTPLPSDGGISAAGATSGVMAPEEIYVFSDTATQVYDAENDRWTSGAPMPTSRGLFGVAVVNDFIHVIGGGTAEGDPFSGAPPSFTKYAANEKYTPIGYGTVPPVISVVSPENKNYTSSTVSLTFTLNKPTVWMGYSLDGQKTVTVTGNTTINGLIGDLHNITVYAKDEFGNTGFSETAFFTISVAPEPQSTEPFPTVPVLAVTVVAVVLVGAGLLVYLKKRQKGSVDNG